MYANISSGGSSSKYKVSRLVKTTQRLAQGDRLDRSGRQLVLVAIVALFASIFIADLSTLISRHQSSSSSVATPVWASWIGEVPTAAEVYGEAANDMPTAEAFDDDDDDDELDASASNEYPDNDESYEDPEDKEESSESGRQESWIRPTTTKTPAARVGGQAVWSDLEGWRRNKRDLEDRIVLASRRAAQRSKETGSGGGGDDEFAVDDGDEDAWVHDGIDDIHIDPETKRAASEHSYDERSIDAEYDPKQDGPGLVNRTRITTIAEVIPMNVEGDGAPDSDQSADRDSTRISSQFAPPDSYSYLPASYLTMDQVQKIVGQPQQRQRRPLVSSADR